MSVIELIQTSSADNKKKQLNAYIVEKMFCFLVCLFVCLFELMNLVCSSLKYSETIVRMLLRNPFVAARVTDWIHKEAFWCWCTFEVSSRLWECAQKGLRRSNRKSPRLNDHAGGTVGMSLSDLLLHSSGLWCKRAAMSSSWKYDEAFAVCELDISHPSHHPVKFYISSHILHHSCLSELFVTFFPPREMLSSLRAII